MSTPPSDQTEPALRSAPTFTLVGKGILACVILAAGYGVHTAAITFRKKAEEKPLERPVPDVELVTAVMGDYPVALSSQGMVEALTETRAASEVSGRIIYVSPLWNEGKDFHEGDVLLKVDDADYRSAMAQAEATLAEAQLALQTEEARAAQALREWKKLESGNPENDLVTRGPYLKSAKAKMTAAEAAIVRCGRDIERCVLRAPYDGRIRKTLTDLGSFVAPGTPLVDYFSTAGWQVRLPLSLDDFASLDMTKPVPVILSATIGGRELQLPATATGTTGEIDRATRTVSLMGTIPPGIGGGGLLAPGLFLRATLEGRVLPQVVRLPRRCVLPDGRVAIATADSTLRLAPITLARSGPDEVYISTGVAAGDRVLATTLAILTPGMKVRALPAAP